MSVKLCHKSLHNIKGDKSAFISEKNMKALRSKR